MLKAKVSYSIDNDSFHAGESVSKEISKNLEKAEINRKIAETNLGAIEEVENIKRSYSDVIGMIEDININNLTPLAAFDVLVELVNRVKK